MINSNIFRSVLDNSSEGVRFLDRERHITYWNKGAEDLTGYRSKEVMGSCSDTGLDFHFLDSSLSLCGESCLVSKTLSDGINSNGTSIVPQLSMGATLAGMDDTRDKILKRADQLMYMSKSQGKDTINIG